MVNVGIIGCGKIAQTRHLPEYAANKNVIIAGVCDTNLSRAKEIAAQYHTKAYASCGELLSDVSIDAVSICAANAAHCQISLDAMNAGKHVLCEKPMAVTYEECCKMVETSERTGRFLMIGHNQRLTKTHKEAHKLVKSGIIGKIVTFRTMFGHCGPETWTIDPKQIWFFDKKTAAFGAMADLGIHKTDLIQFLTDEKIVAVTSRIGTLDKKDANGQFISVDDNAICIYELTGGIMGIMMASWSVYGQEDNSTVLYGTEGVMHIYADPQYSIIVERKGGERIFYSLDKMQTNDNQTNSGIIDLWVDCLLNKREPEISGKEALSAMRAVFAALKSAQEGRRITLSEDNL